MEMCRQTYNDLLSELREQLVIDISMIQQHILDLKITNPRLRQIYSKTLQYECYKLFSNLTALRSLKQNKRKVGKLRFKEKDWFKAYQYNQSGYKLEHIYKKNGKL
jgi:putative transposase